MKTNYNKFSPLEQSKSFQGELLNDDFLKMNILKQKNIHEPSSILQKDAELRKISQELHNRIMNQRFNFNKPIKFTQFFIHQSQNNSKMDSTPVINYVKKEQQSQLELSKHDTSQFISYEQEQEQSQILDKIPIKKKQFKIKHNDIVKSILIKSITKSFHDDSINIINNQSKPKSISINEQNSQLSNNCALKHIDQYILDKLENIAQDQLDNSYMSPLSYNQIKTSTQKNSLLKLIPITTATAQGLKIKRIRFQDGHSNSKLIQDLKNESGVKNYEITRKAQERITLYQKILKMQNESRSKSQSGYFKKKLINSLQNRYNN